VWQPSLSPSPFRPRLATAALPAEGDCAPPAGPLTKELLLARLVLGRRGEGKSAPSGCGGATLNATLCAGDDISSTLRQPRSGVLLPAEPISNAGGAADASLPFRATHWRTP
jgi:hypothetical protein